MPIAGLRGGLHGSHVPGCESDGMRREFHSQYKPDRSTSSLKPTYVQEAVISLTSGRVSRVSWDRDCRDPRTGTQHPGLREAARYQPGIKDKRKSIQQHFCYVQKYIQKYYRGNCAVIIRGSSIIMTCCRLGFDFQEKQWRGEPKAIHYYCHHGRPPILSRFGNFDQ